MVCFRFSCPWPLITLWKVSRDFCQRTLKETGSINSPSDLHEILCETKSFQGVQLVPGRHVLQIWGLLLGRERMLPAFRYGSLAESKDLTQAGVRKEDAKLPFSAAFSFYPQPSPALIVGTENFCSVYLLYAMLFMETCLSIWNLGPILAIMQRPYFHISLFWCVNPSPKCLRIPWQAVKRIFTTWLNCHLPTSLLASVTPRVPSLH